MAPDFALAQQTAPFADWETPSAAEMTPAELMPFLGEGNWATLKGKSDDDDDDDGDDDDAAGDDGDDDDSRSKAGDNDDCDDARPVDGREFNADWSADDRSFLGCDAFSSELERDAPLAEGGVIGTAFESGEMDEMRFK